MMTTPPSHQSPRRPIRAVWWVLGLFAVVVLAGLGGGYGVARLLQSPAPEPAEFHEPERTAAASPPAAAPNQPPSIPVCVLVFDIYSTMHNDYADGVDFSETRLTAADRLRTSADLYPEPERTSMIAFSDVLAADAQISGDDREAVLDAVDREGDAWLEFNDAAC